MAVPTTCPHCGSRLNLSPEWVGKQVRCGKCQQLFVTTAVAIAPAPITPPPVAAVASAAIAPRPPASPSPVLPAVVSPGKPEPAVHRQGLSRGMLIGFATSAVLLLVAGLALGWVL